MLLYSAVLPIFASTSASTVATNGDISIVI